MKDELKPDAGKIADAMLAKSREHLMGSDANFERVHAVMANLTTRAQSFVSVECVVEVLAAIERLSPQPVAFVNSYELAKLLPDDENAAPDRTPGIQRTQSRFRNVPLYAGPQPAAPECSLDNCLVPNKCQRAPDCAFGVTAAPAQSGEPVKIHKLWAHGGCTGINDYLMTDFSIRTLKVSEIKRGQTFPDNDGSHETVSRDNPYAASLAALKPSPTAVVLDDERAALLADYVELNMSNYGPDDVDKLNAWGIEAYGYLARAASPQPVAQPVERTAPPRLTASFIDSVLSELWPLRPAVNERGHGTFDAVRSEIRRRLSEAPIAQPVEQTRALTDAEIEQFATDARQHEAMEFLGSAKVASHDNVVWAIRRALTAARPASDDKPICAICHGNSKPGDCSCPCQMG